jgi:hypothetical protein
MKKLIMLLSVSILLTATKTEAQVIDLKNISLDNLLGKVLQVKKGWAPQFFSGKNKIPKLNLVGQLLNTKKDNQITKLFNTFKTGRLVYRITNYAGTAFALYGTVKNIINNADSVSKSVKNQARTILYSGLSSMSLGTIVKLLTKGASYKAVDLFGGVIKKKLMDIISFDVSPATNYVGKVSFKAGFVIRL